MTKDNGFDQFNSYVPGGRTIRTGVALSPHGLVCTTAAQLRDLPAHNRHNGLRAHVRADGSNWEFSASAADSVVDTTNHCVMSPDAGSGRWLRTDTVIPMKFAVGFATADDTTIFTVPTGFTLEFEKFFWEITTSWTGGTSSAIGVSGTAPHATAGDLLGGAAGAVLAELTTAIGYNQATVGVSYSASPGLAIMVPTDTIEFDRITSAFTAGAGFVHAIAHRIAG